MIGIHRDPKQELLRSLPLFEACSDAELKDVAAIADELSLLPDRRLTTEGAAGQDLRLQVRTFSKIEMLPDADFAARTHQAIPLIRLGGDLPG